MNLYENSLVAYGNLRGPPPNNANIPQEIAGLFEGNDCGGFSFPLNKAGLIFLGSKPSWQRWGVGPLEGTLPPSQDAGDSGKLKVLGVAIPEPYKCKNLGKDTITGKGEVPHSMTLSPTL